MELMQEISVESKKLFSIGSRSQCMDILMWLLAKLQKGVYGTSKTSATSVVYEPFQVTVIFQHDFETRKLISEHYHHRCVLIMKAILQRLWSDDCGAILQRLCSDLAAIVERFCSDCVAILHIDSAEIVC
jgi:hypothetical protein